MELDSSKLRDPSKLNTTAQPQTGSKYDNFDVRNWGGADFKDSKDLVYVFTPAGTVKTNSLPNFDCDFHIVVNNAVAYEVAAIPTSMMGDGFMLCFNDPDQYFKLRKVCDPYTINITALGEITVTKGVTGLLEGSVEVLTEPGAVPMASPAPPPVIAIPPNNDPVIEKVEILPKPNPATLPLRKPFHIESFGKSVLDIDPPIILS